MDLKVTNNRVIDISIFPRSICFSFYTSKEIRKIACAEIFCPVFFDIHGDIIKGGLCDERMGVFSKFGICKYCKGNYSTCPGHFGYIDLPIPVANNFLRNILITILKTKCLYCGFFRILNTETIFLFCEILNICFKFENLFPEFQGKLVNTPEKLRLGDSVKLACFKNFQNLGKKINKQVFSGAIKNKFSYPRNNKNHQKCEDWARKLSTFFLKCKENYECPKCGFINFNKKSQRIRTDSKFQVNRILPQNKYFYKKNHLDSDFSWILDFNEKISYRNEHDKGKNFLDFQFKQELECLWKYENDICELIWGKFNASRQFKCTDGSYLFYINSLLIPANRFRPFEFSERNISDSIFLTNPQNFYYMKILKENQIILLSLSIQSKNVLNNFGKKAYLNLEKIIGNMGDNISNNAVKKEYPNGIKQQLEKKNGIFRMHLMGKRVFHSARSIITPDPFLKCNQVGVPVEFSNLLTLPEKVNPINFVDLTNHFFLRPGKKKKLKFEIDNLIGDVLNVQNSSSNFRNKIFLKLSLKYSKIFSFDKKNFYGLNMIARNLNHGDIVLMNRQPSLHRVSIMSHTVKIEANSKCFKLNYCNCNSYNADFDGDEMNMHVPQNLMAQTEARVLSNCSNQNKIPVNDCPTRGLIQDYILSSIILTRKDTFINSIFFNHLLNFSGNFKNHSNMDSYPAILKPIVLWTGKQFISILWKKFSSKRDFKILESRTKFSKLSYGIDETKVLFRKGELLRGMIDNSQLGKNKFGALHAYYEINGGELGDLFLSEIGSILIIFLRNIGYSLNFQDLLLLPKMEKFRKIGIKKINQISKLYSRKVLSTYGLFYIDKNIEVNRAPFFTRFIFFMGNLFEKFIQIQKNNIINLFSKNLEICIPGGLYIKPYENRFSNMALSGAKGSILNIFQISLNLGQTELESNCIPRNSGGKTLPSYFPFDLNAFSNGFISNRFVSGITQPEFFFHCMAGREGLLDTAVKTSQSGYIQRCLMKHLESIYLGYDHSIRFSQGQVNQFVYSRNGCSPMNLDLKSNLSWKLQNLCPRKESVYINSNRKKKLLKIFSKELESLPINEAQQIKSILKKNKVLRKIHPSFDFFEILTNNYSNLFYKDLFLPGEAIGVFTAQSIGEPCTQMTLNTFHFAGKLESAQKSGIPRLKELILLSSKSPVTPTITANIKNRISPEKVFLLQRRFMSLQFNDLLKYSSHYIEKSKHFEGHVIRVSLQKKFFYKHLHLLKMKSLEQIFRFFIKKFKKTILNHKDKKISKNNKNTKIELGLIQENLNHNKNYFLENKIDFFGFNFRQYQNNLDINFTDMFFKNNFTLNTVKGLKNCYIDHKKKYIHVNGINFMAFWKNFDLIDLKKIFTNDIYGMMINYGIEASRNCLFNELESIFKTQGISISSKHFDLISDYMTRLGKFRGFNRKGFREENGFQEITYETAISHIINSSISHKIDNLTTVSSRLSLGLLSNIGTGCFGLTF